MSAIGLRAAGGSGLAATLGGASLFLRRLRLDAGPALAMFVLLGFTCFLFAALPRFFNDVADRGLRHTVATSRTAEANVRVLETARVAVGDARDPLGGIAEAAAASKDNLPSSLSRLVADTTYVVRSPSYVLQRDLDANAPTAGPQTIGGEPGLIRYLVVALYGNVRPNIRLVAGRMPEATDVQVTTRMRHEITARDLEPIRVSWSKTVPLLEVALSTETARRLQMKVGDRAVFRPRHAVRSPGLRSDVEPTVEQVPLREAPPIAVRVSGLFVVTQPQADYWFGDRALGTPGVFMAQSADVVEVEGQALLSAEQYTSMLAATRPIELEYEFRHYVEPGRLDAGRLAGVRRAVRGVETRYAGAGPLETRVETGLGAVVERYEAAHSQAKTLLAVVAIGLFACALANVGLLGVLWYSRRRRETGLARVRGASPVGVLAAQAAEVLLIAVPAGLLGWLLAVLFVDGRSTRLSAWLVAGLVAATVAMVVGAVTGAARRPVAPLGREDVVLIRPSARRLVLEGLVAAAAGLGAYLLRRRGLEAGRGDFDPYLAAVPVLLALAVGLVALRLYPFPIRGLAHLLRGTKGLSAHLGLSRAARQSDIGSAPLLVVTLALAIGCFSASMLKTLAAGQERTAWRTVGADVRVDAPPNEELPTALVSKLAAEGEVARAYVQDAEAGDPGQPTPVIALDLDAYRRVVAGTPAAVRFPPELRAAEGAGLVPAVASNNWPTAGIFPITFPRETVNAIIIGNRQTFPGVAGTTPFAVVRLADLGKAAGTALQPNRLYLRDADPSAVSAAVREAAPGAEVEARSEVVSRLRAPPLVGNVFRGFGLAIVLAALYAAVAVALLGLVAGRSRARDLALVRTMGASPRDTLALAAVELVPFVLTALLLGIGLGVALPHLVAPGLDLAFFTGTGANPVRTDVVALALFSGGLLLLVTVTVVVAGTRARAAGLDRVLRMGER